MRHTLTLGAAIASLIVACGGQTTEALRGADVLPQGPTLTTDKSAYSRADLDPGSGQGIRATLVGSSEKSFYSRLGDAFNGAVDQNPLFVAEGSDGTLERQSGGTWVKTAGVPLVEGVREIVISPAKSYTVIAPASAPIQAGTYRLTIKIRDVAGGAVTATIASPAFEVR
jgi:hypothetical protein